MKKTLLVLGGSHAELPIIDEAKKLGLYVYVTSALLDDFSYKYADKFFTIDYSDQNQVLGIFKNHNIDYIYSGCNDFAQITASYVSDFLNLKTNDDLETTYIIHHKDKFRKFCLKHNIISPQFLFENDQFEIKQVSIEKLNYPLIVKPVDLTGGKGVSIVKNYSKFDSAVSLAFKKSRIKKIIFEEFIDGSEHSYSAYLHNQKVVLDIVCDEYYFKNKYLVSSAKYPSFLDKKIINTVKKNIESIACELKLIDGIFHAQFIVKESIPYIIDVCRRPPGDLFVKFSDYIYDISYINLCLKSLIKKKFDFNIIKKKRRFIIRHCIMSPSNGLLKEIKYDQSILKNIIYKLIFSSNKELITDYSTKKLGIIFLEFKNYLQLESCMKNINNLIEVIIE